MTLTEKCQNDFYAYMIPELRKMEGVGDRFFNETIIQQFEIMPICFKNAMIIDFFDSVGIYTNAISYNNQAYWKPICDNETTNCGYKTRKEAIEIAIKWGNESYNKKNTNQPYFK